MTSFPALQRHVDELCERHEIVRTTIKSGDAWGAREHREIGIQPIRSVVTYMVALHEIGHILGQHQDSQDRLVRERWAWHWARKNALIWTAVMQRRADRCYTQAVMTGGRS